jgi:hypothetical protein
VLSLSQGEGLVTYKGRVKDGAIVLEPAIDLPDGVEVRVDLAEVIPEDSSPGRPDAELAAEKGALWQALQDLPDGVSFEDVLDELYLLYKIDRGVRQLDSGQGVAHEGARKQFSEWLD